MKAGINKKAGIIVVLLIMIGRMISSAQEGLMPLLPEPDSAQMEMERETLYQQLVSGKMETEGMMLLPEIPKYDFNDVLKQRYSFHISDYPFQTWSFNGILPETYLFAPTPFLRNSAVFSAANYKLNDKFTLGGYSFGANSVFSAPLPNQGMHNFDTRGSTLFMQYKVSKNLKIETRVSVTQGPGGF